MDWKAGKVTLFTDLIGYTGLAAGGVGLLAGLWVSWAENRLKKQRSEAEKASRPAPAKLAESPIVSCYYSENLPIIRMPSFDPNEHKEIIVLESVPWVGSGQSVMVPISPPEFTSKFYSALSNHKLLVESDGRGGYSVKGPNIQRSNASGTQHGKAIVKVLKIDSRAAAHLPRLERVRDTGRPNLDKGPKK